MTGNTWQRWSGIMKAVPFEEKRLAKWQPPFIVQPKFDGIRCRSIPIKTSLQWDAETLLLSSEENIIYGTPHINMQLRGITAELDGELYCHGMSFEEILSITSRTVNIHPDHKKIQFHVFDIVNKEPQMRRQLIIENLRGLNKWLVIAPFWMCESLDDVMRAYDQILKMNYEGIIVRHNNAPYEKKRSLYVMKFKPKKEDEYEIVGFTEEVSISGNPKGSLGALICNSGDSNTFGVGNSFTAEHSGNGNTFNIGTGFTAEQRSDLWTNRDSLIGKVAKVQYQHLTSRKKVPRFPVFVEVINND